MNTHTSTGTYTNTPTHTRARTHTHTHGHTRTHTRLHVYVDKTKRSQTIGTAAFVEQCLRGVVTQLKNEHQTN